MAINTTDYGAATAGAKLPLAEALPGGMAGGGTSTNPGDFGWVDVRGTATPPTLAAFQAAAAAYAAYMAEHRPNLWGAADIDVGLSNQGAAAAYNRALEQVMGGPIIEATPYAGPSTPTFNPETSGPAAGLNIPGENLGAGEDPFAPGTLGVIPTRTADGGTIYTPIPANTAPPPAGPTPEVLAHAIAQDCQYILNLAHAHDLDLSAYTAKIVAYSEQLASRLASA